MEYVIKGGEHLAIRSSGRFCSNAPSLATAYRKCYAEDRLT